MFNKMFSVVAKSILLRNILSLQFLASTLSLLCYSNSLEFINHINILSLDWSTRLVHSQQIPHVFIHIYNVHVP